MIGSAAARGRLARQVELHLVAGAGCVAQSVGEAEVLADEDDRVAAEVLGDVVREVSDGGAGCADCHHNGNKMTNGAVDNTFQDYNIHEPGVVSETTVDGLGPFFRPKNDYFFTKFGPPQDEGSQQNLSSRNTKHLRSFWDSVPRWLHHGDAHSLREVLLAPDSPLLRPNERGFNFRTVRTDQNRTRFVSWLGRPPVVLPTEVPITFGDSHTGGVAGDGMGQLLVSLDDPFTKKPDGSFLIDQLGTMVPKAIEIAECSRTGKGCSTRRSRRTTSR